MKKWTSIAMLASVLVVSGAAVVQAQPPVDNIGKRHPNLDAAQHLCTQAAQKLSASQQANEFDEGGHAQKAKELLDQANQEMKLAAETDNARRK